MTPTRLMGIESMISRQETMWEGRCDSSCREEEFRNVAKDLLKEVNYLRNRLEECQEYVTPNGHKKMAARMKRRGLWRTRA